LFRLTQARRGSRCEDDGRDHNVRVTIGALSSSYAIARISMETDTPQATRWA
jgi:hypothetical protein